MPTTAKLGPARGGKQTQVWSPTQVAGTQVLEPPQAAQRGALGSSIAGAWIKAEPDENQALRRGMGTPTDTLTIVPNTQA